MCHIKGYISVSRRKIYFPTFSQVIGGRQFSWSVSMYISQDYATQFTARIPICCCVTIKFNKYKASLHLSVLRFMSSYVK